MAGVRPEEPQPDRDDQAALAPSNTSTSPAAPSSAEGPPDASALVYAADLRYDAKVLARATRSAARRWRRMHYCVGGPAVVAAAVAGASAIQNSQSFAAVFAIASAILTGLTTWLNPGSTADRLTQTSRQYAAVSERIDAMLRLDVDSDPRTPRSWRARLEEYREELNRIRDTSPDVPVPDSALRVEVRSEFGD